VDTVISVCRPEGNQKATVRVLQAISRFSETPPEMMMERVGNGYVSLGSRGEVAKQREADQVLGIIPDDSQEAVETTDLQALTRMPRARVQKILRVLFDDGSIRRSGAGKKGSPYRYFRAGGIDSAQTSNVYEQKRNGVQAASTSESKEPAWKAKIRTWLKEQKMGSANQRKMATRFDLDFEA
jgi:hypothetical protein